MLLSIHYVSGIADTRETVVNETDSSYVHAADTLVGVDKQHTHMQYIRMG